MDANGIGTDATMAEHILKIKTRDYVRTQTAARNANVGSDDEDAQEEVVRPAARGRGRGRGGRGGRGGRTNEPARGGGGGGNEIFIPTTLGTALYLGYEKLGFENSLTKPFLRKEVWDAPACCATAEANSHG